MSATLDRSGNGETGSEENRGSCGSEGYQRTIWLIAAGTFLFAAVQAIWAVSSGSAQFLKDAIDWIYTVMLYGIAAFVFGRGVRIERVFAIVIAGILAVAGMHTLYDLWNKIIEPRPIDPELLGFSAVSATAIGYLTAGCVSALKRIPVAKLS